MLKKLVQEWVKGKREHDFKISLKEYILMEVINYRPINKLFFPILIREDLIQFTDTEFISKGSGDSYYLVLINGKYLFFKVGFEPDCDGAYYYGHTVAFTDVVNYSEDFQIRETFTKALLEDLNKI